MCKLAPLLFVKNYNILPGSSAFAQLSSCRGCGGKNKAIRWLHVSHQDHAARGQDKQHGQRQTGLLFSQDFLILPSEIQLRDAGGSSLLNSLYSGGRNLASVGF